jgi:type I restriction enzyme, S subunit
MTLPRGWTRAAIGDIADVVRGRLSPQEHPDIPFVGMDNVEAHTMRIIGTVPSGTMKSSAVHFVRGDVLYGRLRPYLNKVVQPDFDGLASAEFIPVTPREGVLPEFIRLRMNSADFVAFASHLDEGDRPRVDWDGIRRFELLLPPSAEQARIVANVDAMLSRLDASVASLDVGQRRLKAYRASVLRAAVEGRLVPTEAELARMEGRTYEPADVLLERIQKERRRRWEDAELAKMAAAGSTPSDDRWKRRYPEPDQVDSDHLPRPPEGWCWTTVDEVGDVLLGRQRAPQFLTGEWSRPYLRVANIKDDRIDLDDIEEMDFGPEHFEKYRLQPDDILVSEGQSPHLVGQSAVYRGGVDGLCFQKTLHRFRPFEPGPRCEYAQTVFRAHVSLGVFRVVASITTNIAHLTLEKFKRSRFPLPPAAEQGRIADEISRLMSVVDASEREIVATRTRLRRLRQSILAWAFEGKLSDQAPADEPADALLARLRSKPAPVPGTAPNGKRSRKPRVAA